MIKKDEKSEYRPVMKNDVICVKKCTVKLITKEAMQHPVIIFLEPIQIIYNDIDNRIGQPKEFTLEKDHVNSQDLLSQGEI